MKFAPLALLLLPSLLGAPPAEPSVDEVFQKLYDFDFPTSQSLGRTYTEKNPGDPLGHASLAASILFSEMNRLQVFNKDLFKEEKTSGDQAKRVAMEARATFAAVTQKARETGEAALRSKPDDTNALLAMVIVTGAERDFAALIDKRYKDSYDAAKASQSYALRLQKVDPDNNDAWFTRGFSEYLIGSVPYVLRWIMKIDQVEGNKQKGLQLMEKCARGGRYLKPFSQMLLASIYRKEHREKETRALLEAYAAEHPQNPVIRKELEKLARN